MTAEFSLATDPFMSEFREAAGLAAAYEMGMRLVADKNPKLESVSLAFKFQDVEDAIRRHFKVHLTSADEHLLDNIRPLRNKLLHGELRTARERMTTMGHPPGPQRIRKASIPTGDGLNIKSLMEAVQDANEFQDTEPQQGNLFGWLLQMVQDGSLAKAAELFRQALALVDRLAGVPES